jgi:translocation and assembly module TamB
MNPKRKVLKNTLRVVACTLGLIGVALVALIAGVFLHLDTKLGRRLIVANVAPLLANTFRGKIVIDRLDSISPFRASGVDARVLDEHGALVASLNDASVDFDTVTLLRSGIRTISIPNIHARHAEVVLLEAPSGSLTLVESFEPKTPSPPSTEPPPDVRLPRVRIDHVWTHGKLTGLDIIDAEAEKLDGSLDYVSEQVVLDVHRVGIVARSLPKRLDPEGTVSGKLTVPPNAPLFASATFDGSVNRVPVWVDAGWKNEALTAAVDVPRASADELRRVLKDLGVDLDVREAGSLSLRAQGRLDAISANARVSLGTSKIDVFTRGSLLPDLDLNAVATVRDFDAHAIGKELERTRVSARASSRVRVVKGEPVIAFTAEVDPFVWDGNDVPATRATGTFVSETLTVDARVAEPGAPVDASIVLRGDRLDFQVDAESRNLAAIRRVKTGASGSARVSATGSYRIDRQRLDAVISVSGSDLAYQGQKVRHLDVRGRVQGPVQHLSGDVKVEARRLSVDGRDFASASVEARGAVDAFQSRVVIDGETAPDATATFSGSVGKRMQLSNILLDLDRRNVHAKISADAIVVDGANIEAKNVIITGPGSLTASGRWQNGELTLVADGKGLDVTELARMVDVELPVSGYLNLQADLALTSTEGRGTVSISARNVKLDGVENGALDGRIVLEGRKLTGNFHAQHRALDAKLALNRVELTGNLPLTDVEAWKGAIGEAKLTARTRIVQLRRLVKNEAIERYRPSGRIEVDMRLSREKPDSIPDLRLTVATRRLQLADPEPKQTKRRAFLSAGHNLACSASIVGDTRSTDLSCVVTAQKQTLVELRARTILPELRLWRDRAALLARMENTRLQAQLVIVERSIEEWPSFVRPRSFAGRIGGTVTMDGTLLEPDANVSVWAQNVVEERLGQKVAARVDVKYDGKQADFRLSAKHGARAALTGDGAVRFSLAKLLHSEPQKPEVDAHAKLDRLELASIPFLKDNRIAGRVSGKLDADHLGTAKPKVAGRLDFDRLLVGTARIERGNVQLDLDTQKLVATVELQQRDGSAHAALHAVPVWKGFAPGIDPEKRMTAKLVAKKLSASMLLPAVRGSVSDLDGRIDADLALDLQRGRNQVRGFVRVSNGEVQVPAIGQALDHVNVYVAAEPGGVLRLREASLQGVSGKLSASGWAKLDGFALSRAQLGVRIREKEKLPLTLEGVLVGDIWGGVDVAVQAKKQELAVDVNVRSLHLELPPTKEHSVQTLDPDPHVRIGVYRRQNGFVMLPVQPVDDEPSEPLQIVAKLNLGNDIWIEQGPDLNVRLGGQLVYRTSPEARMTGQIRIASGKLDVQGKMFEIQEGTISFQGNPTNPIVVATATWESPEGIVVYAEYRGPVEGGKLTLHAEPSLSRDQIVSLLLFGSPDGSLGGEGGSKAGTATSVGGGVATKGLNRAMNDLTSLDVSTRIDTSEAGSPRPELVWQLTPRVSAQLGYNVEAPAPGKSPDRTLLTLEFRLFRRWSLASTFGDRGSTLFDLLWRYRY